MRRWSLGLFVLVACGKRAPDRDDARIVAPAPAPAPVPAPAPRSVEIPEPEVALPRELAFELLDAGAQPRAPLRYTLAPGSTRLVTRAELASRELDNGTWRDAPKAPATVSELTLGINDGGRLNVEAAGGGVPLALTVDSRGRLGGLADHAASHEEVVQRLLATVVPLPEEPIGKGARWRVVTAFRQQGAVLKQTATYTLEARGKRWTIGVDIQRLAERQRVGDVELVAIVRRLQGTFEIDPAALVPRSGKLAVQSSVHARSGPGENIVEDTGAIELTAQPR